jgi:hypothetical protein
MAEVFNEIKPGVPLTAEQKEKMAKENASSSAEAQKMAADMRARDERESPVAQVIANSVKEKLEALPPKPEEVA